MSSDVRTSIPSAHSNKSSSWAPVLFVLAGVTSCCIEVVSKRGFAIQATKNGAAALAREACSRLVEAIGFTIERVAAAEVDHA